MYQKAEDPTTIIPASQHRILLKSIQSIFNSRNELGAQSKASFKKLMQDLNTQADFADTLRIELADMIDNVDTFVSFETLLTQAKEKLETILYQQATPEREAYFTSLNTMVSAPGNKSTQNLTSLIEDIITPLESRSLSDTERAIIELIKATVERIKNAQSLWKRYDDPTDVLNGLSEQDIPTQLSDLEELLVRQRDEDNGLRITSADITDQELFIFVVGSLVDRRDQMSNEQRSRLTTIS